MNSEALTKVQTIIVVVTIVVAVALGGVVGYLVLSGQESSSETIKIGVLANVIGSGKGIWQEAVLACEQLNAEGGVLGRQVEVIRAATIKGRGSDVTEVTLALDKLISVDQVDFVVCGAIEAETVFACQEKVAEYKKIFFCDSGHNDEFTQRVLDDYNDYKYFFSFTWNTSSTFQGIIDSLLHLREMTSFDRIGYLGMDSDWIRGTMEGLNDFLPTYGFDLVYAETYPQGTMDFSSYFAHAEANGVEVLVPLVSSGGIPVVKEYHDRQSPMVIYGGFVAGSGSPDSWEWTDGKCNYMSVLANPGVTGYPLTSKTLSAYEDYVDRWGENPVTMVAFDIVRFILPDAIERAGTVETDAVIEALEETSIETATARNFVFTKSHCIMVGENPNDPEADYPFIMLFQWQDGELVPVYPKKIMDEANATFMYPDWDGPWNK